ncbi:hypothetical protein E3C22_13760 [Jiella endophytica]|uniref:Uncharacterized protein n=1 Tax=Jiella endophytica TaxID=2558362 RepID=A0A4Y8RGG5_9HYPH|nr:hypothetical protein [Jiella endophytica]TFF21748.1 hypothetical protein E3C22_13760 [Jiella endophytica]
MNALFASTLNVMLLSLESQQAAQLRLFRLGVGGPMAVDEATLMVREKIEAFDKALGSAMAGSTFESIVDNYRTIVQANIQRLKLVTELT